MIFLTCITSKRNFACYKNIIFVQKTVLFRALISSLVFVRGIYTYTCTVLKEDEAKRGTEDDATRRRGNRTHWLHRVHGYRTWLPSYMLFVSHATSERCGGTYLAEVGAGSLRAGRYRRLLEKNTESGLEQKKGTIDL